MGNKHAVRNMVLFLDMKNKMGYNIEWRKLFETKEQGCYPEG